MEAGGVENGEPRWRPTVPTVLVVASVVIALVAVSGLLVDLFRQTTGPGEVLRDFSRRMDQEDCPGTYALLAKSVQDRLTLEEWCGAVSSVAGQLSPDFRIDRVVLQGEVSRITVTGEGSVGGTWLLVRDGRSWRVLGAGQRIDFPIR